jgi:hypothetical protein
MSLRTIHLFFILASIALAFGVGYWALVQVRAGDGEQMVLAVVCNLAGVGILGYGIWFAAKKFALLKEDT